MFGRPSEGYASRRKDGFTALLDIETARAAGDTLGDIAASLDLGGRLSGPAAKRVEIAAERFQHHFSGRVLTRNESIRFMDVSEHRVYVNPDFFSLCAFDPSRALCRIVRPEETEKPQLNECRSGCGNLAYTDELMVSAELRASDLEHRAANPKMAPFMSDRLLRNAGRLRHLVAHHRGEVDAW